MVALSIRAKTATGIFGTPQADLTDQAFAALDATPGLFYIEDFKQFADFDALWLARDKGFHSPGFGEVQLIASGLGTAKAVRLIQKDRGQKGGSWGQRYNTQGGPGQVTEFYWQSCIRLNRALKEWRFDGINDFDHQMKLINLEQFASGQVVVNQARFCPGPGIMMNGGGLLGRFWSTAPYGGGFASVISTGVGNGTTLSASPTLEDVIRTYGYDWKGISQNEFGEASTALDLSFRTSAQTGGNPQLNFLGATSRNWPHGGYGLPDIMHPNFVEYPADDWLVIEVHVKTNATANLRTVELYAAPFGHPPKLQVAYDIQGDGTRETDLSFNSTYYSEWELLIYNTPTVTLGTDRPAAVGYQPDLIADHTHIRVGTQPIPFPNPVGAPFTLPGNLAYPAWVDTAIANGWAIGTWAAISGSSPTHGLSATNKPRDVKTVNPSDSLFDGINSDWGGGWFAPAYGTYGTYGIGIGGGHGSNGGYTGNDVFRFDMGSRTWAQIHAAQSGTPNDTFGEYADGSPAAMHTYFTWVATPALPGYPAGLLINPRSCASASLRTPDAVRKYARGFDLATGTWIRFDPIPGADTRSSWKEACAAVWDPVRSRLCLWAVTDAHAQNTVALLDPLAAAGSQWSETRPANANGGHGWNGNGIEQVLVYDPVRDIIISIDWRATTVSNKSIRYLKPGDLGQYFSNNPTGWPITTTGTEPSRAEGGGFDWSTIDNCGYFWRGEANPEVYKFAYSSGSLGGQGTQGDVTFAWSTTLNSGANTVTPALFNTTDTSKEKKHYNRFRIVRYGSFQMALVMTHADGPVYAYRMT